MASYATGPRNPTVATTGVGGPRDGSAPTSWANVNNIFANDGANATFNSGGSGWDTSNLTGTGYGFALPAAAIVTGIMVEINWIGTSIQNYFVSLNGVTGVSGKTSGVTSSPYIQYGADGDLWGATSITAAQVNAANFGAAFDATVGFTSSGGSVSVDHIRITVYWKYPPADVQKSYIYKVYNGSTYLGDIPNVISEFNMSSDINTAGSQITIEAAVSADTASVQATTALTDESAAPVTDESLNNILTEGMVNYVGAGTGSTLIKNGNTVVVWEFGHYYPNGQVIFRGKMERWEANFGGNGENDSISMLVYSDGSDLDNYLIVGGSTTYTQDQYNGTWNTSGSLNYNSSLGSFNWYGQTITVGAGVKNIAQLSILLGGSANGVTINVYSSSNMQTLLGKISQNVSGATSALETVFTFANRISVTPGSQIFFTVELPKTVSQSINLYYQNTAVYAGGTIYNASYSGGSGGGTYGPFTGSMWFRTQYSSDSTITTYTSNDPSVTLKSIIDSYRSRGGLLNYKIGSVDLTALSLTYTFNTNTIYEGVKAMLSLAPNGFYFYADVATDILYFKRASVTPDIILTKDATMTSLVIKATIEQVKNSVSVSGGIPSGQTTNLYKVYADSSSIALYGQKLDRRTDNRVTVSATADAIGNSAIAQLKDEQYQTIVKVLDQQMDLSLLHVGQIVGFRGHGTFVDQLLEQIVRIDYTPEEATLTLGLLPKRLVPEFERITRGLIAQQTIANPATAG
jgi:hypothetical protein